MTRSPLAPHLVQVGHTIHCSACGREFPRDAKPSLSRAFLAHLESAHRQKNPATQSWNQAGETRPKAG